MKKLFILFLMLFLLPVTLPAQKTVPLPSNVGDAHLKDYWAGHSIITCERTGTDSKTKKPTWKVSFNKAIENQAAKWKRERSHCRIGQTLTDDDKRTLNIEYWSAHPTSYDLLDCKYLKGIFTCKEGYAGCSAYNVARSCNRGTTISDRMNKTLQAYINDNGDGKDFACQLMTYVEHMLMYISKLSQAEQRDAGMQEMVRTLKYIGYEINSNIRIATCRRYYAGKFDWSTGSSDINGFVSQLYPQKKVSSTRDCTTEIVLSVGSYQTPLYGNFKLTKYTDGTYLVTGKEPVAVDCQWKFSPPRGKSLQVGIDSNGAVEKGHNATVTDLTPFQKEQCAGRYIFPLNGSVKADEYTVAGNEGLVGDMYLNEDGILVSDFPVAYNCSRMVEPEYANKYFGVRIEKKTGKILQGKARFMTAEEKQACDSGKMFEDNKKGQEYTDTKKGNIGENFHKNKRKHPSSCKKDAAESDASKTSYHCTKTQIINNEKKVVPDISPTYPQRIVIIWVYKDGHYDVRQGKEYELSDKNETNPKEPKTITPPAPDPDELLPDELPKMKCNLVNYTGLCADGDTQEKELTGDRPGWEITSRCPVEIIGKNIRIVPDDIDKAFVVKVYSDGQTPAYEIVENGKELLLEPKEEEKDDEKEDDDKKLVNPDDNGLAPDAKKESTPGEGHGDEKDVEGSPFGEGEDPEGVIGGVPKGINTSWWYKIGFRAGAVPKIDKFTRDLEQVEASQQGGGN